MDMRFASALALLWFLLAPPSSAQRGGARGGFGGGGHAPAGGGFHGGISAPSRPGFGSAPRFGAGPGFGSSPALHFPNSGTFGYRAAPRSYQPTFGGLRSPYGFANGAYRVAPSRPRNGGPPRSYPRARAPWLSPVYPYPVFYNYSFLDPFWGFGDNFLYDQTASSYAAPDAYAGQSAQPYAGQGADPYAGQQPPDAYGPQPSDAYDPPPPDSSSPMVYAPYPYYSAAPSVTVINPPAPQPQEDVVTLFFKDGRPPEQIRNYALTRSALLLPGQHMREIPLDDIDLLTTERVNRALGVEFRVPEPN